MNGSRLKFPRYVGIWSREVVVIVWIWKITGITMEAKVMRIAGITMVPMDNRNNRDTGKAIKPSQGSQDSRDNRDCEV